MEKLRFCLIIPTLQVGGMERVMSELALYFSTKKNAEVHIVIYGKKPEIFYQIPKDAILHKPRFKFDNRYRLFYSIRTLLYLRMEVKHIHPTSILSFGELWNSFVLLALLNLNYPVYISDRCNPAKKFSPFHSILRYVLYPKAKGIIAQTETAKSLYYKKFKHKNINVIGNPVKLPSDTTSEKQNIILSIGRLIETKHHDRLIRIFSKLDAPDWKLVIIGADALKENNLVLLQQLIEVLNLQDRVILTGGIKNVYDYYFKSKLFAFTSSSEGFPNVIAEALSTGLPVVSYDCVAGPSEMITEGVNGYLVSVFEDGLFQARLQHLIDNEESLVDMSESARKSIKKFVLDTIGEEYYSFITSSVLKQSS